MGSKYQVMVLTSTFPRWTNDVEPSFVEDLSLGLSKDFDIFVLAPMYPGAKRYEKVEGLEVHRFNYWPSNLPQLAYNGGISANLRQHKWLYLSVPFFFMAQFVLARHLIRLHNIKMIHAHWLIPQGIIALLLKGVLHESIKVLITSHGGDLYSLRNTILTRLKTWVIRNADRIAVVSSAMQREIEKLVKGKRSIVAPMGVDLKERFRMRNPVSERDGIIFVGRLVEKKGLRYLLDAYELLLKDGINVGLKIIGDGPERLDLENRCKIKMMKENIAFLGAVPNELIPNYLNKASIFVLPSIVGSDGDQEGLGLVAIEAMGCGCAVIASDLPAVRSFIHHQKNGILIPAKDSIALYKAIRRLIKDNAERERLASDGHTAALNTFDWTNSIEKYRNIYKMLLGSE